MVGNDVLPKKPTEFICEKCYFKSSNKKDFTRHTQTKKHFSNVNQCFSIQNTQKTPYECNCGKIYKDNSGLWRHKKKCLNDKTLTIQPNISQDVILDLIQDNKELKQLVIEQSKTILELAKNGLNNTNSHNNSHNKTFNLQFFLNETCKDAMNITDFVNSIQLQLPDLETVGELGFVNGISNIIIKKLNTLDFTQRPMHCTDKKREVIYVKDENKWEKDNDSKDKLRGAIKTIAHKNTRLLKEYREKHPDYNNTYSNKSDKYNHLVIEAMGGKGDDDFDKQTKIIQQISNRIVIEKENLLL